MVLFYIACLSTLSARGADKKAIQKEINQAYYNLKSQGFDEVRCNVIPDWDTAIKAMKADEVSRNRVLPIAKAMKFKVVVGPSGAASVSYDFGQAPPNQGVAEGLREISEGMAQMLGGFFQTWSQMMVNPPLAGGVDDFQMEETADGYRFTADHEKTHAVMLVKRDFVIDSIEAKTPEFAATVRPHFAQREKGFVMTSYEMNYTAGSSSQQGSVTIDYQEVSGLTIPRTITVLMSLPQGQLNWPMTLEGCQVKRE